METKELANVNIDALFERISSLIEESRKQVAKAVNIAEVYTKFEIERFKNRKHCLRNSKHLYSVSQVCFELESLPRTDASKERGGTQFL